MTSRWADALAHDPAYNPNLTVASEDFGLAWPPRVEKFDWPLIRIEFSHEKTAVQQITYAAASSLSV